MKNYVLPLSCPTSSDTIGPANGMKLLFDYVVQAVVVFRGEPPRIYPTKPTPRVYQTRKAYLYHRYLRLLQSSSDGPLLLLYHNDFAFSRLTQLRSDIRQAAARHAKPTLAGPNPAAASQAPTLEVIRTSLFGVALRDFEPLDQNSIKEVAKLIKGPLAILAFPSFDPPQIQAILRALARSVPPRVPKTPQQIEQERKQREASFVPGRRQKRQRSTANPDLKLLGALIEGKVFTAPGVQEVAKLSTLDTLRAQLVGMLSAPAMQLAAVLNEASGAKLARTLEGFKKSLEEEDTGGKEEQSAAQ
ncbi:uncharacterized protein LAESUDRAFT_735890 [Laetiporus sulphureus 93-53]|uniref:Ribosomal protein L10 n=1 Tax=Laetiporus sulphureus 93-53 TaxID=1314785 RepID=A0A165FCX7_9APHY|nr:uncharacterized protein LAESUDRAFT_735890 [Laetiporus sulphureus 93-53]KZT08780.1 hypothetical protein LAESUDRAFT_735890 [Laetiporus sulphureus 93-53]